MGGILRTHDNAAPEAPALGDHLALDMLNTRALKDGVSIEYWNNGADVWRWLARNGVLTEDLSEDGFNPAELLSQAVQLRELALRLIELRQQGIDEAALADLSALNGYLSACSSAPQMKIGEDGRLVLLRVMTGDSATSLLGPVAEAVAEILVRGDFSLVKQCEHPDCVLWFYDRTKAHKRRWCSMAVCGNRYKAAQFRKRSNATL